MRTIRPSIERRESAGHRVVDRTSRSGNRLGFVLLAFLLAIGIVYFVATERPGLVKDIKLDFAPDSLIARIPGALTDSPPQRSSTASPLESLHAAIVSADVEAVRSTLKHVPPEELNRPLNGMTTLMQASSIGNASVLRALLAHGADPNARGAHQRTALQYAAERNRLQAAQLLLDANADINGADNGSLTPLIMAADRNYTKFALLLIERGANVNVQNIEGWTALMDAAEAGNLQLVKALLAAGARTQARHHDRSTALDFAQRGGHQEIVRVLSAKTRPMRSTGKPSTRTHSANDNPSVVPDKKGERQ